MEKTYSPPSTQTYLINEPDHGLPIVSVAMSPSTLFHPKYGIMMDGPYINEALEYKPGANYWTRKEYLCNVEIFEDDQTCLHNGPSGFRIFGGYSRVFPQKSFVLTARKRYGSSKFEGEIFPKGELKKYKYLVLRNGGSDWNGTHFRDELMGSLLDDWGVEKQAYRPAVVYLNGKYWGLYNIREKINTRFIADHKDLDQDSIDLLEHKNTVRAGNATAYNQLIRFVETHNLAQPNDYARVSNLVDIDNFIDFQIAQIYCVNHDAGGNTRYWRPQVEGGKWRWIFFDMDWGFGLHSEDAYRANTFKFFTEANGPSWPNPPWSTLLLRNLLKNDAFKARFVNRFCDRLNTDFSADYVLVKIGYFEKQLGQDMARHLSRWALSESIYKKSVETTKTFATERPRYLLSHMEEFFQLGAQAEVEIVAAEGGSVLVNGAIDIEGKNYHGHYYENFPIDLVAKPHLGYHFVGWEGWPEQKVKISPQLIPGKILRLKPKFEPFEHPLTGHIIMNEVAPFNKKSGDWLEIYNNTQASIPLGGWKLINHRAEFTLPDVQIAPKGFILVCRNARKFKAQYPLVDVPIIDGLSFGLDKSVEEILLATADGDIINSLSYRVEPAQGDYTIDLLLPTLDNGNPSHWGVHIGAGSPGQDNPLLFSQLTGSQKDWWTRVALGISLMFLVTIAVWWKRKFAR